MAVEPYSDWVEASVDAERDFRIGPFSAMAAARFSAAQIPAILAVRSGWIPPTTEATLALFGPSLVAGAALAYTRFHGQPVEELLANGVRFALRRRRLFEDDPAPEEAHPLLSRLASLPGLSLGLAVPAIGRSLLGAPLAVRGLLGLSPPEGRTVFPAGRSAVCVAEVDAPAFPFVPDPGGGAEEAGLRSRASVAGGIEAFLNSLEPGEGDVAQYSSFAARPDLGWAEEARRLAGEARSRGDGAAATFLEEVAATPERYGSENPLHGRVDLLSLGVRPVPRRSYTVQHPAAAVLVDTLRSFADRTRWPDLSRRLERRREALAPQLPQAGIRFVRWLTDGELSAWAPFRERAGHVETPHGVAALLEAAGVRSPLARAPLASLKALPGRVDVSVRFEPVDLAWARFWVDRQLDIRSIGLREKEEADRADTADEEARMEGLRSKRERLATGGERAFWFSAVVRLRASDLDALHDLTRRALDILRGRGVEARIAMFRMARAYRCLLPFCAAGAKRMLLTTSEAAALFPLGTPRTRGGVFLGVSELDHTPVLAGATPYG